MKAIATAFGLIPVDLKGRFYRVVVLATLVAILEMLGVASIMPFVAMLTDPVAFERSLASSPVGHLLPTGKGLPPVHVLGLFVIAVFATTNILSLVSLWASIRFSALLGVRMSHDLAEGYFRKGYLFLQSVGAGVLANDVTRETEKLAVCSVLQLCLIISKLVQVLLVVSLLAAVSPVFMLAFSGGALFLYVAIYAAMRGHVSRAGFESTKAVAESSRKAFDLFSAAKNVLIGGHVVHFIRNVENASSRYFKADAVGRLAPVLPRYLIELVAFSALLAVPIYRSATGAEYQSVVPVITLFAYAGYRILPAIQQLYGSYSILKFYDPLAQRVSAAIQSGQAAAVRPETERIQRIESGIELKKVCCRYPEQEAFALQDLDLRIERNDKLAIIGSSGAGKSTLMDVLLGIVPITGGEISVGSVVLTDSEIPWSGSIIGYVPQAPLMISASVAENIAFGVPVEDIDLKRCREAAQLACVDDVINQLPEGYSTVLGEGVNLSGGESQRIAIARALYKAPQILFMDEPSSALDPMISSRVVQNLCSLEPDVTLIVVTHDWELLPVFSKIAVVDEGRVVAHGQPDELAPVIALLREKLVAASEN